MCKVGDFVTATLIESNDKVRQGVVTRINPNGTLTVRGESGSIYICKTDAAVVPDKNLFGETIDFVLQFRKSLNIA